MPSELILECEAADRLNVFYQLLVKWNESINLVSGSTLPGAWDRHIRDSSQLIGLASPGSWLDLGTGGGFPGLVCSIVSGRPITLVDSDQRKCAFLRAAARATEADATVICCRIMHLEPQRADVVTARGVGRMPVLLQMLERHMSNGGVGILMKGRDVDSELAECDGWRYDLERLPSVTDPEATILKVSNVERR